MICPTCNIALVKRKGQHGEFWACPNFQTTGCRHTVKAVHAKPQYPQEVVVQKIPPKEKAKDASFYVAYVKDLMVAGVSKEDAIEAIKQAKEAFE